MNILAAVFIFFVVAASFAVLYIRIKILFFPNDVFNDLNPQIKFDLHNGICKSQDAIYYIQRQQWNKAKVEVLGNAQMGFQGSDMFFYKRAFGAVDVSLAKTKHKRLKSIVYYRIFKNANDNIRSMLLQFGYLLDNNESQFFRQNCIFDETCVHPRVNYVSTSTSENVYYSRRHRRYAFTFIRNPLLRFISALTEIEYRLQNNKNKNTIELPISAQLGSQMRIQEFINMLLLSGGSRKLFKDHADIQIAHIAPQIGTYILANKIESNFNIYRLENFENEWYRLSNDTRSRKLKDIYKRRTAKDWRGHKSSDDPYNTTLAAKSFLSYSSGDIFERMNISIAKRLPIPRGYSVPEYQKIAKSYLRGLCRIYLADFLCLNYTLPIDCADLQAEFQDSIDNYKQLRTQDKLEVTTLDYLRELLPESFIRMGARLHCFYAETPECEAKFVHGHKISGVDRHEEL